MRRTAVLTLCGALVLMLAPSARSAPSPAQKCQADVDNASGKLAGCRLKAEASLAKTGDAAKYALAIAKCATKFFDSFGKAMTKYGASCPMTESGTAFDAYLTQCSDDTAAAAGGASLPDYAAEIATCEVDLAACEAKPEGKVGKTAQTTCWNAAGTVIPCAGTGQDGAFQKGLALSYADNGDGTITDDNTGLMWEKLSDDGSIHDRDTLYTWTTAVTSKIVTLNSGGGFAGNTDWRLPNRKELESILNLANVNPAVSPAFSTGCVAACTVLTCSCTQLSYYWSSSSIAGGPSGAWIVGFDGGGVAVGAKTASGFVRAVRGGS